MRGSDRPLVLVVGADAGFRAFACKALPRDGLRALEVADWRAVGAEVLACRPDLLVLDMAAPDLDAGTCCRDIRAHGPLSILFLAGSCDALDLAMDLERAGDEPTYAISPRALTWSCALPFWPAAPLRTCARPDRWAVARSG
jgi:DNA-binding response OmpR family regulator